MKNPLQPGTRAPYFHLKALDGESYALADSISEKPTVLAFFKVSCPTCQLTFPFLERLSTSDKAQFIGISQNDPGETQTFNDRFGVSFPTLLDEKKAGYPASNSYQISNVPTVFVVEPSGEISWMMEGFSKAQMIELGVRAGVETFNSGDRVPDWKPG